MGRCNDQSVKFLKGLGYNVVRHPRVGIAPLDLVGKQNGEFLFLGPLNLLITNPPGPLPSVTLDQPAGSINGQTSSKIDIGLGATILGSIIGAMGGNLGLNLGYTNAQKMTFTYGDVVADETLPLAVGNYLRSATVDAGNLILREYVFGNGDLFLITRTVRSRKFTVTYERTDGVPVSVDVPALQGLAGANLKVSLTGGRGHVVTFEGPTPLVFGFQCLSVGVENGVLSLENVAAGAAILGVGGAAAAPTPVLEERGLLNLRY
jgi:hypothetical protein